jgi:putative hemolysin
MHSWLGATVGLIAIPALVLINGFFVAAEFALVTVRHTRVDELVRSGRFGAKQLQWSVEHLDDSLAAAQVGITLASLALGWIGEPALADLIEPLFRALPGGWSVAAQHAVGVALAFLLITYMHIVLGEQVPKVLAIRRAEESALLVATPLFAFARIARPFLLAISRSSNAAIRTLRLPPLPPGRLVHSVEELRMLVDETQRAGVIAEDQASYLKNVFRLTDKRVREVMVPREKVVTMSAAATEEEVLETARETAHTRLPVWEGDPDNIVGIVNTKDLFHLFSLKGLVILMDALYPPLFVHPDQRVAWCLQLFRREKRPMAVVRDARGSFVGIVTLEDILEEIVGEIEDEHDDPRWETKE